MGLSSYAGTESGGGGGVLRRGDAATLLDFLNLDPELLDSDNFEAPQSDRATQSQQANLKSELNFQITDENELLWRTQIPAFDLALKVLRQWDQTQFDAIEASGMTAFRRIQWRFVNKLLADVPLHGPLALRPGDSVELAAYYSVEPTRYTVEVSIPLWNQLDLRGQAGLVLHEALRHVQISYAQRFDDQTLQRATAVLIVCQPTRRLNYFFMHALTLNNSAIATQLYGDFKTLVRAECVRSQP